MKNLIEELEKEVFVCDCIGAERCIMIEPAIKKVSAVREELKKRAYCPRHIHSPEDVDCNKVILIEDVNRLLGEKKFKGVQEQADEIIKVLGEK